MSSQLVLYVLFMLGFLLCGLAIGFHVSEALWWKATTPKKKERDRED